jgi:hypothetical protein
LLVRRTSASRPSIQGSPFVAISSRCLASRAVVEAGSARDAGVAVQSFVTWEASYEDAAAIEGRDPDS